jgi:hypothetical protein
MLLAANRGDKSTLLMIWYSWVNQHLRLILFVPKPRRLPGTPTRGFIFQQKSPTIGEAKTALR